MGLLAVAAAPVITDPIGHKDSYYFLCVIDGCVVLPPGVGPEGPLVPVPGTVGTVGVDPVGTVGTVTVGTLTVGVLTDVPGTVTDGIVTVLPLSVVWSAEAGRVRPVASAAASVAPSTI